MVDSESPSTLLLPRKGFGRAVVIAYSEVYPGRVGCFISVAWEAVNDVTLSSRS